MTERSTGGDLALHDLKSGKDHGLAERTRFALYVRTVRAPLRKGAAPGGGSNRGGYPGSVLLVVIRAHR